MRYDHYSGRQASKGQPTNRANSEQTTGKTIEILHLGRDQRLTLLRNAKPWGNGDRDMQLISTYYRSSERMEPYFHSPTHLVWPYGVNTGFIIFMETNIAYYSHSQSHEFRPKFTSTTNVIPLSCPCKGPPPRPLPNKRVFLQYSSPEPGSTTLPAILPYSAVNHS